MATHERTGAGHVRHVEVHANLGAADEELLQTNDLFERLHGLRGGPDQVTEHNPLGCAQSVEPLDDQRGGDDRLRAGCGYRRRVPTSS